MPTAPCSRSNPRPASAARDFSGCYRRAGLACTLFASWEYGEGTLNLLEFDGFVPAADPRIARFRAQCGAALYRVLPFGGYALPLPAAASLPGATKG